jgi:hypothetical protein
MAVVAGVSDDLFGIDVASERVDVEQAFRQHLHAAAQRAHRRHAVPRRTNSRPRYRRDPRPAPTWLRDFLGRPVAADQSGRRSGRGAGGKIHAGQRQALRAEPRQGVLYTASAQGAVASRTRFTRSIWPPGQHLLPAGGGIVGPARSVLSDEGTAFLGTGDAQFNPATKSLGNAIVGVKLDAKQQLQLVDYFGPPNANWLWRRDLDVSVTPMSFDYRGRKFLVGTSKECRMWVLDREALGGDDHRTSLFTTPLLCNDAQAFDNRGVWGAMAYWQDATGAAWVLVPFWGPVSKSFHAPVEYARPATGGVAAYRLEEKTGKWQ